jgi:hypothetical protein
MKAGVFSATAFSLPPKINEISYLSRVDTLKLAQGGGGFIRIQCDYRGPQGAKSPLHTLITLLTHIFFPTFVKFANVPKLLNSSHSKLAYHLGLTGRVFKILFR